MKVQIEIEIPDGYEITSVMSGEPLWRYENNSEVILYTVEVRPAKPFLINGVPSDWPEWLTCDWVAKDKSGSVFGYLSEPTKGISMWRANGAHLITGLAAIDIPGSWEQSKHENPRRKK